MKIFITQNFFFLLLKLATWVLFNDNVNSVIAAMGLNHFCIQFRLLPGTATNGNEHPIDYSDAPILQTNEFIECK
jgi:hypothetical protein